jgi:hypothetical protein
VSRPSQCGQSTSGQPDDPRFLACVDFLGRTGAASFQIRYSDDEQPVVWMAVGEWAQGHECAAGLTPLSAVVRLVEQVGDGGMCAHCGRASGVSTDWAHEQPLDQLICWHVYDPETRKFRRSCEGETSGRAYGRDPRTGATVGRNDPCPCGSGKKWKRCHGAPRTREDTAA